MTTTESKPFYTTSSTSGTYGYTYVDYRPLKRKKWDKIDWGEYKPWTTGTTSTPYKKEDDKEDVKKLFNKKILIKLKDGMTVEITYGELYEIEKTGRIIEELTVEELKEMLVMLKL